MNTVFIIKELWIDSMENIYDNALGYSVKGFVLTEEEAQQIVDEMGDVAGTGWPISKGQIFPKGEYEKLGIYNRKNE